MNLHERVRIVKLPDYGIDQVVVGIENCAYNETHTLEQVVEYCRKLPEVIALNPDSDYNELYFTIDCYAESIEITFRRERD